MQISKIISSAAAMSTTNTNRILLHGGDNMLGRAVQLTFPIQAMNEEYIRDSCTAQHYLEMSLHEKHVDNELINRIRNENSNAGNYLWDNAPKHHSSSSNNNNKIRNTVRILNLETAVTKTITNDDIPTYKGINYHMHIDNYDNIISNGFVNLDNDHTPVIVSYSNNHCIDFGRKAFDEETLPHIMNSKYNKNNNASLLKVVGCGTNFKQASEPVIVENKDGNSKVEIFAMSTQCSGTPKQWEATDKQSGIVVLPGLYNDKSVEEAKRIVKSKIFQSYKKDDNTIRILSIHWGPNWALKYEDSEQLRARQHFAHWLIDECGVDLIYGHSSHHIRGLERYHNKLILYGTGDIVNDYEGFENRGEEQYVTYGGIFIVDYNVNNNSLQRVTMIPTYMNKLRLERLTNNSLIWKPNERIYEGTNFNRIQNFAKFINKMSRADVGQSGEIVSLVTIENDIEFPGGPVLRSKNYG